jgi:hypothetical protein
MKQYTFRSFIESKMQFANNNPISSIANNISELIDWTKKQRDQYNQSNLETFQNHFILPLGRNMDLDLAAQGAAKLKQLADAADSSNQKDLNLINGLYKAANDMKKLANAKAKPPREMR